MRLLSECGSESCRPTEAIARARPLTDVRGWDYVRGCDDAFGGDDVRGWVDDRGRDDVRGGDAVRRFAAFLTLALALFVASSAGAQEAAGATRLREPRSLVVDVGGALVGLGGYAFPRIPLRGTPNESFHLHGQGAAFKLHYDFTANDLDWRLGLNGAYPGYFGAGGTVGVRKDLSVWDNPRLVTRGGAGAELMVAGGAAGFNMLVPVFKVEGEMALEVVAIPDTFHLGAVFDLAVRYGLPLGVGFDLGSYLRANFFF